MARRHGHFGRTGFRLGSCLAATMIAAVVSACAGGGPGRSDDSGRKELSGQLVVNGHVNQNMVGAWRVLGHGTLLEISKNSIAQFEEAKTLCYPDPGKPEGVRSPQIVDEAFHGIFEPGHARVEVFEVAGAPVVELTLERIDGIPANCRAEVAPTPQNTFKAMWEMMDLDYAFFSERHIDDWGARFATLAPKAALARDDSALQAVLIEAVHDFNDDHVQLRRLQDGDLRPVFNARNTPTVHMLKRAFENQTRFDDPRKFEKAWKESITTQIAQRLTESSGLVLNGAVLWGKLSGNVGYIGISRMVAYGKGVTSIDESRAAQDLALIRAEMDRAIKALAGTKAMIVDVTLNMGGRDLVSAEIAGRFADTSRLAFTKRLHRPQGTGTQSWYISPKGSAQYLKPVYLLTSDRTVSAGETFTLMMRELRHVKHVGQTTAGSLSDILEKPLPGNFLITIPNEIYLDPRGVLFEGGGIPPQQTLAIFDPANPESLSSGHAAAITALLDSINH
jgi:carboxyl-terminal processing protease